MNLFSTFIRLGFISAFLTPLYVNATTYVPISVGDITIIIPINNTPIANDDVLVNLPERHTDLDVTLSVLDNDIDEDKSTLVINLTSPTSLGGQPVRVSEDNQSIILTVPKGWNGTDVIRYSITDSEGQISNVAQVTATLVDANDPPIAMIDRYVIDERPECGPDSSNSVSYLEENCSYTLPSPLTNDFDEDSPQSSLAINKIFDFFGNDQKPRALSNSGRLMYSVPGGLVIVRDDGDIDYIIAPSAYQSGRSLFDYTIVDNDGLESPKSTYLVSFNRLPQNRPPVLTSVIPVDGTSFTENDLISLSAIITDPDANDTAILSVSVDGASPQLVGSEPYSLSVGPLTAGSYTITFQATDAAGAQSSPVTRNIQVTAVPNLPPSITSASPSSGASFSENGFVVASAEASDEDGSVASVEFRLDGGNWITDDTFPFTSDIGTLGVGPHRIEYRAKDDDGDYSAIVYRDIEVTEAPNIPPIVSVVSPSDGSTYFTYDSIVIVAEAQDFDGTVAVVDFRIDGGSWKPTADAPYENDLGTLPAGTHIVEVRARDDDGEYSEGLVSINITVNTPPRRIIYIHTDALGSPAAETDENGEKQ